jgi:predicted Rdx family selenoprotein
LETFTLTIGEVDVLPTIKDQFTITVEGLQVHNIDKNGDT